MRSGRSARHRKGWGSDDDGGRGRQSVSRLVQEAKGEMDGDEHLRLELGLASAGLAAVPSFDIIDVILIPFSFFRFLRIPSYIGFLDIFLVG
jgi:hypothetical protein